MFLLADVNSMYCACEQVFRPDLKGRPVAVLSNNDGALVAINREGKKLGLKRGMPFFQAREIIKNQNVTVFSSNYALYGDMSARCMTILESLAPAMTIYSIDEHFFTLPASMPQSHSKTTGAESVIRCFSKPGSPAGSALLRQ